MKVVYNGCYGGFSLSHAAIMRYAELKGLQVYPFVDARIAYGADMREQKMRPATAADTKNAWCVHYCTTPEYSEETYWRGDNMERDDPVLVQVVEELGPEANGMCANLQIEDVPAGTFFRIDEYDGNERVMTQDAYDWKQAS
jgi:hypothetical protein